MKAGWGTWTSQTRHHPVGKHARVDERIHIQDARGGSKSGTAHEPKQMHDHEDRQVE